MLCSVGLNKCVTEREGERESWGGLVQTLCVCSLGLYGTIFSFSLFVCQCLHWKTLQKRIWLGSTSIRATVTKVCAAIEEDLKGAGQHYVYRLMWQTLRQKYSVTVRRNDVRTLMLEFSSSGVKLCARWRFVKRLYSSLGPNHVWHIDGYDKLKPYGLAISGCIDEYSWKVIWLVCLASNNDAGVIAQNYVQYMCQNVGLYQCVSSQRLALKRAEWSQSIVH